MRCRGSRRPRCWLALQADVSPGWTLRQALTIYMKGMYAFQLFPSRDCFHTSQLLPRRSRGSRAPTSPHGPHLCAYCDLPLRHQDGQLPPRPPGSASNTSVCSCCALQLQRKGAGVLCPRLPSDSMLRESEHTWVNVSELLQERTLALRWLSLGMGVKRRWRPWPHK
jgi:hypothetical protein